MVGDHQPQHCIAQELEAFIRRVVRVLGTPGPVGECVGQQGGVGESVTDPLLQRGRRRYRRQSSAQLRYDVVDGVADGPQVF